MKKRWLCLTGVILAAACLSGCQQKDPEPGEVPGYDQGEEYLSIWVHSIEDTEEGQAYRESVESFNEAYDGTYFADIEFVPRNDSGGGYSDKVNASVMAGGLPDVLTVDGPNVSAYAANGIIQPLADLTEEEESEYLPSIIEQGTVNGDLYALGVMESSVGFYYNKDIIEEAGIEIPDADDPWTWSEFLDILEELKPLMDEKDGYPLDMTFPVGETSIYYYAPFVWSGHELFEIHGEHALLRGGADRPEHRGKRPGGICACEDQVPVPRPVAPDHYHAAHRADGDGHYDPFPDHRQGGASEYHCRIHPAADRQPVQHLSVPAGVRKPPG